MRFPLRVRESTASRRLRSRVRPALEGLEGRTLLSATTVDPAARGHAGAAVPLAATGGPVVDTGQVPFQVQVTAANIPNAPALQSAVEAQWNGKWLFLGGRTNGLHGFGPGQDFPPEYQNTAIVVIDPRNGRVWSRPWSDSRLSQAAIDALTSTNQESLQQGKKLYVVGGYGVNSATGVSTTFDTLTAINLPGLMRTVIHGGNIAAQVRQTQDPRLQVTGGQMAALGGRDYLVMGQSFLGDYSTATPPPYIQNYTDTIASFRIVDNRRTLGIANYRAATDATNFHRRDFMMSPVILPNGQAALEAYGGVFTPNNSVYRQPITIRRNGSIAVSSYQQYFSQYTSPQIPIYDARTRSMHTIFLGGISLYNYFPAIGKIVEDPQIPFINTITDLMQSPSGTNQEYVMPVQLPGLMGAEAQYMPAARVPQFASGVIKLKGIRRPTTIGYMYGGILAQQANFGNTTATGAVLKVTLVPRPVGG